MTPGLSSSKRLSVVALCRPPTVASNLSRAFALSTARRVGYRPTNANAIGQLASQRHTLFLFDPSMFKPPWWKKGVCFFIKEKILNR